MLQHYAYTVRKITHVQGVGKQTPRNVRISTKKTNADRIRSMSDEELAKFIENIKARAAFCKVIGNNEAFEKLYSGEWLQQPMEVVE